MHSACTTLCTEYGSSVRSLSRGWLFATPWTAARQASLSIINSGSLTKPMSVELVMPSNHLILCCPLLLLPSIFPSIRVFSNESALFIRWPKYWSYSFNISPSIEHPGLISFRMDWLDLLVVPGTLKSLLQHHSSKASILRCSAFFIVQLSHPYVTTGKTIALTRQTFVGKVRSLLFNMLSRLDPHQQIPSISARKPCLSVHNQWHCQLGIEKQQASLFLMTFKGELGPAHYGNETKREGGGKIGRRLLSKSWTAFHLPPSHTSIKPRSVGTDLCFESKQ